MRSVAIITDQNIVYNFNPTTGETRYVTVADRQMFDIDFDNLGNFYGLSANDAVYRLNPNSGATDFAINTSGGANALEFSDTLDSGFGMYFAGSQNGNISFTDGLTTFVVGGDSSTASGGDLEGFGDFIYWTSTDGFINEVSLSTGQLTNFWFTGRAESFGLADDYSQVFEFSGTDYYAFDRVNAPVFAGTVPVAGTIFGAATLPEHYMADGDSVFIGSAFDDYVYGSGGDNQIYAGVGNDELYGDRPGSLSSAEITAGDQVFIPSTGQSLALSVTVPAGSTQSSIDVSGFISRQLIQSNDFNVVYVIDTSGSMGDPFQGSTVGDVNGDGSSNQLIDGTIAAFEALNSSIVQAGLSGADVRVVEFNSSASTVYTGTAGGNVSGALRQLDSGGGTDYENALRETISALNGMGPGENRVFFLSDGFPNDSTSAFADEVQTLLDPNGLNAEIRAIGLGNGASLSALDLVDDGSSNNSAERVLTPAALTAGLTGSAVATSEIARLEVSINGVVTQVLDANNFQITPLGLQYNVTINGLDISAADVVSVDLVASDPAGTRAEVDIVIPNVNVSGGSDTILAGEGNDFIDGGGNTDALYGEGGFDTIIAGLGSDIVDGGGEFDTALLRGLDGAGFDLFRIGGTAYAIDGANRSFDIINQVEQFGADGMYVGLSAVDQWDPLAYVASYNDLSAAFGLDAGAGLGHYLNTGFSEGREATFNAAQYLVNHGDLLSSFGPNLELARNHFIASGVNERRLAEDPLDYIASYDDLIMAFSNLDRAALFGNGLAHYQNSGFFEGRREGIDFDPGQYLANHGDLAAAFGGDQDLAAVHYIQSGFREHRLADDPYTYIASNADLIAVFGGGNEATIRQNALDHWQRGGWNENRSTDTFDVNSYLANYDDLRTVFADGAGGYDETAATLHWITSGFNEGRTDDLIPV